MAKRRATDANSPPRWDILDSSIRVFLWTREIGESPMARHLEELAERFERAATFARKLVPRVVEERAKALVDLNGGAVLEQEHAKLSNKVRDAFAPVDEDAARFLRSLNYGTWSILLSGDYLLGVCGVPPMTPDHQLDWPMFAASAMPKLDTGEKLLRFSQGMTAVAERARSLVAGLYKPRKPNQTNQSGNLGKLARRAVEVFGVTPTQLANRIVELGGGAGDPIEWQNRINTELSTARRRGS